MHTPNECNECTSFCTFCVGTGIKAMEINFKCTSQRNVQWFEWKKGRLKMTWFCKSFHMPKIWWKCICNDLYNTQFLFHILHTIRSHKVYSTCQIERKLHEFIVIVKLLIILYSSYSCFRLHRIQWLADWLAVYYVTSFAYIHTFISG